MPVPRPTLCGPTAILGTSGTPQPDRRLGAYCNTPLQTPRAAATPARTKLGGPQRPLPTAVTTALRATTENEKGPSLPDRSRRHCAIRPQSEAYTTSR